MVSDTYYSIEEANKSICCNCKKVIRNGEIIHLPIENDYKIVNHFLCFECSVMMDETDLCFVCQKCGEVNFYAQQGLVLQEINGTAILCETINKTSVLPISCRSCTSVDQ